MIAQFGQSIKQQKVRRLVSFTRGPKTKNGHSQENFELMHSYR